MTSPSRRLRALRHGRAIHLLDIENLTGSGCPTTESVHEVMALYARHIAIGPMDHFIAAVSHHSLIAAGIALRGMRLLARSGRDGADRALVETARHDRIDLRFERVVIGSGDHYFTGLATWLRGRGIHVTVLSHPNRLSRQLRAAALDVVTFPPALSALDQAA
ncbi:NYN domain-containing protein [Sinosporangium album]|uniref:NYN domain-containing protein n=1 Tax=Sinosporangium album TaxID=504805 RepID=A0A1G8B5A2_9ACTN|nr:NYN domain-containing protein [Sinosporangium album]SDH28409.1 NYN domain-containing protein [Sinosporangium album]